MTELESLLADWIKAEVSVISEFSGDIRGDWSKLIERAKRRATALSITWGDQRFVPSYVLDLLGEQYD